MDILKLKEAKIEAPVVPYLNVSVFIVQKCNFNDEFLVEHMQIPLAELDGKPLSFFDPYMGRRKESTVKIAVAKAKGKTLYLVEDKVGERSVFQLEPLSTDMRYTEDNDERTLISVHLSLTSYKY